MLKLKCSNCGKINTYTKKELKDVFPFSRERLICENCGRKCKNYSK